MQRFSDDQQALDYIASRIANEAQCEGIQLSEVERKMLYFSETAWTLPDIWTVSDEFDKDYDQDVYEKKISQLIKKAVTRARKQQPEEFKAWREALRHLSTEDRFLLVMVKQAGLSPTIHKSPKDLWKRRAAASAIVILFISLVWFIDHFFPDSSGFNPNRNYIATATWGALALLAVVYGLLRLLIGGQKIDGLSARAVEWFLGYSKPRGR